MRVKVGNNWYEATPAEPIQVELTDKDKENIANMAHDACLYAIFAATPRNEIERGGQIAWMLDGSRKAVVIKSAAEADSSTQIGDTPHV